MSQTPTIGRIVHYSLSEQDVKTIEKYRTADITHGAQDGEQNHQHVTRASGFGNPVRAGDMFPAIVVRVFPVGSVNLQVFLDGNDTFWATSASEGEGQRGHWSWPPRV